MTRTPPPIPKVIEQQRMLIGPIKALMAGHDPEVQGATLVELLALFLAGHHPDLREGILMIHIDAVRDMIPPCEIDIATGKGWSPPPTLRWEESSTPKVLQAANVDVGRYRCLKTVGREEFSACLVRVDPLRGEIIGVAFATMDRAKAACEEHHRKNVQQQGETI